MYEKKTREKIASDFYEIPNDLLTPFFVIFIWLLGTVNSMIL